MSYKVGFISLGCAKNQVDCEQMMFRMQEAGFAVLPEEELHGLIDAAIRKYIDTAMPGFDSRDARFRYLFRRLEQDTHLAMQLVLNAQKQVNSAEHHCHVTVVATGMHNPFVPRCKG